MRFNEEVTTASSTDTSKRPALRRRAMLRSYSNLATITLRTSQKQQVRYGDEGSIVRPAPRLLQYGSAYCKLQLFIRLKHPNNRITEARTLLTKLRPGTHLERCCNNLCGVHAQRSCGSPAKSPIYSDVDFHENTKGAMIRLRGSGQDMEEVRDGRVDGAQIALKVHARKPRSELGVPL